MGKPNMSRIQNRVEVLEAELRGFSAGIIDRLNAFTAKVEKLENAPAENAPAADLLTEEERAVVEHIMGDFRGKVPYVRTLFRVIDRIAPKPCSPSKGDVGEAAGLTADSLKWRKVGTDHTERLPAIEWFRAMSDCELGDWFENIGMADSHSFTIALRTMGTLAAQQLAAERERVKELEDLLRWICVNALNEAWMYEVRSRAKDDYISLRHIKERIIKALSPQENAND